MVAGNSVAESVLLNLPQKEASSAVLPSASSQVTLLYQLQMQLSFVKINGMKGDGHSPDSISSPGNPPSPHADTHNPAKEDPFKNKGRLPSLCCLTELCPLPAACAVTVSQVACADPRPVTVCLCFPWQRIPNPATVLHLKACPLTCNQLTPGRSLGKERSKERGINTQCSLGETQNPKPTPLHPPHTCFYLHSDQFQEVCFSPSMLLSGYTQSRSWLPFVMIIVSTNRDPALGIHIISTYPNSRQPETQ